MEYDYSDARVQATLAAFQTLDDNGRRAFYWALQNPKRSGIDQLRQAAKDDVSAVTEPETPSDTVQSTSNGIEAFINLLNNLRDRSIVTHIPELDASIAGLERQTLTILAARPSMGKTTLGWQIARNVAAGGRKVLFFSMEVSTASLYAKGVCGAAGLRWRDIRAKGNAGALPADVLEYLAAHAETIKENIGDRLLLDEHSHNTAYIAKAVEKYKPDLVVLDHLRLIKDKDENEVKRLGIISGNLKDIAKVSNCAVLCLAQMNRGVEGREDKRPTLADLRASGEIEENADLILMMYRESYYKQGYTNPKQSETELLIRKFRDDIGNQMVKLTFDMEHQQFTSPGGMRP